MIWPRVAAYRFAWPDASVITAYPEPDVPAEVVWDTYRRSVLPMAMQAGGWEALHASAIVSGGGVVVFCAPSRTGKSTLAYGLQRRGFPQWADDGVVVADLGGLRCVPLPFEVRLKDEKLSRRARFTENGPGEQRHTQPLPIAALCVLRRDDGPVCGAAGTVSPMTSTDAFTAALTHAHEFDPTDRGRRALMVRTYLQLVGEVPTHEIAFATDAPRIDDLLDLVIDRLELEMPLAPVGE
jgi:hypothetical protein